MPRLNLWRTAVEGYANLCDDKPYVIAWDTETWGHGFYDPAFCVTMAWRDEYGDGRTAYFELEEHLSAFVRDALARAPVWVLHSAKYDLKKALQAGLITEDQIRCKTIIDTQLMAHLLEENRENGLKELAVSLLGYDDTIEVPYKSGKRKGEMRKVARQKYELDKARKKAGVKVEDGYGPIPREVILPYAIKDAIWTYQLWELLEPKIKAIPEVYEVYRSEIEVSKIMLGAEKKGIQVKVPYLRIQESEYQFKVMDALLDCAVAADDPDFNPGSNPQVRKAFVEAGYDRPKYDKNALEEIEHPLAEAMLRFRKESKILSSYIEPILREQRDGLFHPNFNITVSTGRMSSGGYKGD